MQPQGYGYQLVKDQLFFRKELRERVSWIIRVRWGVAAVALLATWVAHFLGLGLPAVPLTAVGVAVLVYNCLFLVIARRLESFKPQEVKPYTIFASTQITLDLVALGVVVYFTGGIASPFLIFGIFHIVLTGILLPPAASYIYALVVLLPLAGLVVAQQMAAVPAPPVGYQVPVFPGSQEHPGVLVHYVTFAAALVFSAFLLTSLKLSLRAKGRELLKVSKELETSNAKLTALYDMVKEIGVMSNLKQLMDSATRQAATIMGVKACSIKLLDEQKQHLEFASTFGLSEDYVAKGQIDLEKSPVNRRIIEGSSYAIGGIEQKDHFQFPENIAKEGIGSMLCLPLRGNNRVLGVYCIYGMHAYGFEQRDVDFFSLLSDLTGIAIERVKWDLTKSWFMAKVAHNLRSPLGAILSMLKLVRKGYLGPVNERQDETLERCEKRIDLLKEVIADLLKIGRERTEGGKIQLYAVSPEKTMRPLVSLYQNQCLQKGLEIVFDIKEPIPKIMANDGLIEDLFTNLISNAIKYTPQGGRVAVELAPEDHNQVRFQVSDTGIGIPESDIPRLFSEFFRAENAKGLIEEGTGLGMVIVKEILDRLGGKIQVKSTLGEGTSFTCLIPGISKS
jgi:K+-sensing histidine kinase KdpD